MLQNVFFVFQKGLNKNECSRNPARLRPEIAVLLLESFSRGSYGPTSDVVAQVNPVGYNSNTVKVQASQVRIYLLEKIGVKLPFKMGRGRMRTNRWQSSMQLNTAAVRKAAKELQRQYFDKAT